MPIISNIVRVIHLSLLIKPYNKHRCLFGKAKTEKKIIPSFFFFFCLIFSTCYFPFFFSSSCFSHFRKQYKWRVFDIVDLYFLAARGFGMRVVGGKTSNDGRLYASIVWTVPGGPADLAGLHKGDKVYIYIHIYV